MQAVFIEFPTGDILDVPTKREPPISISPPDLEAKPKRTSMAWLPAAGLLGLLTIVVMGFIHLDNKIGELQKIAAGTDTRLQKVEDAVKVLGSQQSDPTQKLIHDLLAAAQNASDATFAARAVKAAASLTATLTQQQRPASPEFFQSSIAALNAAARSANNAGGTNNTAARGAANPQPRLSSELINTRIALAEYRSSLMPKPAVIAESKELPPDEKITADIVNHRATYLTSKPLQIQTGTNVISDGAAIYAAIPPNTNIVTVVWNPATPKNPSVNGLILIGPQQTLDGIEWKNVTFVNTHIVYVGGPLMLDHVTFVNCTFEVPHDRKGEQVVNYAALANPSLTIG